MTLRILLLLLLVSSHAQLAAAVDTTFVLDEQQSSLSIKATTVFIIPFSDTDTQNLGGTIGANFDFGMSGTFPQLADMAITGAAVSPLNPFSLTLGTPPTFGVNVMVNGAVADVQTPNPPATLSMLPTGLLRYSFDASEFDIILDQGTMVATGAVNQTINLADSPVIGNAEPGTLGELTFLNINTVGPITQVDTLLELPLQFTEDVDVDGQIVTLEVSGQVVANASFNLALSGLPGDFDSDVDVDGDDLAKWITDYASTGSDADADGDSDGTDYLIWQQNNGLGVPPLAASNVAPEPSSLTCLLCAMVGTLATFSRQR